MYHKNVFDQLNATNTTDEQLITLSHRPSFPTELATFEGSLAAEVSGDLRRYVEKLHQDVVELRRRNEELAARRTDSEGQARYYRKFLEMSPDAFLVTDTDGLILEANPAACELLNAPEPIVIGRPLSLFAALDWQQELASLFSVQPQRERGVFREMKIRAFGEASVTVAATAALDHQSEGTEPRLLWVFRREAGAARTAWGRWPVPQATQPKAAEHESVGVSPEIARLMSANRLLSLLPESEARVLLPHLKPVKLENGQVLQEPHESLANVYFPINSVVSLLALMGDGKGAEAAVVGREGMVGVRVLLGERTSPSRVVVLVPGMALRVPPSILQEVLAEHPAVRDALLPYVQARLVQTTQVAACNGLHTLEERLCRTLLMIQDRSLLATLPLTHETLAALLGVRRSGVTVAARLLSNAGVIENGRGKVTILDRRRLEAAACECYRDLTQEMHRLLGL